MSSNLKTITENSTKFKKPSMYDIIMYNDDYTTMQFVTELLISVFHKKEQDAAYIMMKIHTTGKAVVGTYPYGIAVSKKMISEQMAQKQQFPLKITISKNI